MSRPSIPKRFFILWTSRDKAALSKVFEAHEIEAVVHFAASSLVESVKEPLKYYDNNVGGSRMLL